MNNSGRLMLLAVLSAGLFLAVMLFSQFQLNRIAATVRTLHDDRLLPLTQLKQVSDSYAIQLIDVVNKANAGRLSKSAALAQLEALRPRIEQHWQAYLGTELTVREHRLIAEAAALKQVADQAIIELTHALQTMPMSLTDQLAAFDGPLYERIDPLTSVLASLISLQLDVANSNRAEIDSRTGLLAFVLNASMLLTLAAALIAAILLVLQQRHRRRIAELATQQQQLQQFNQALEQQVSHRSHELAAVVRELDSVNAVVAQDLQTPATHLNSYLSELREQLHGQAQRNWLVLVERATRATDRMNQVLNDLLALSRLERNLLQPEEIALSVLLEDVISHYPLDLRQRIRLTLQPLPTVFADRALLHQLLQLLLDNAISNVTEESAPQLTVSTVPDPKGQLAIAICDNGRQPHDSEIKVSLTVCEKILHLHGGRSWQERHATGGSCVYFSLPDMQLNLQVA